VIVPSWNALSGMPRLTVDTSSSILHPMTSGLVGKGNGRLLLRCIVGWLCPVCSRHAAGGLANPCGHAFLVGQPVLELVVDIRLVNENDLDLALLGVRINDELRPRRVDEQPIPERLAARLEVGAVLGLVIVRNAFVVDAVEDRPKLRGELLQRIADLFRQTLFRAVTVNGLSSAGRSPSA
jgi:hypothetical protein